MQGCFWYVPHLGGEMGPALPEDGEMGLLSLGSPHNDAAGVHLAPVCSRKLEGNCGNCYLHGRSNKQVGKRWENSGTAWDGAPEFMNTVLLSVEHDGFGRCCCSPVTAAWTMKAQHPRKEGAAPCSSILPCVLLAAPFLLRRG